MLGSELVGTVRSTDRDGEAIATCASSEVDYLFGVGVGVVVGRYFVFYTCEYTKFALNCYIVLVSIFYYFLGEGYVFLVGEV